MGLTSTFPTLTRLSRRLSTEWCKFLNLHGDAALQDIVGIPRIGTLNQFKSRKSDSLKSFWSNKFEVWVFWRGSKRFKVWFGWTNLDLIVFDLFSSKQVRNSLFQQIFQHYVYIMLKLESLMQNDTSVNCICTLLAKQATPTKPPSNDDRY